MDSFLEEAMKREVLLIKRGLDISGDVPAFCRFPDKSYCFKGKRSIRAHSRAKKVEHRYVRRLQKLALKQEV